MHCAGRILVVYKVTSWFGKTERSLIPLCGEKKYRLPLSSVLSVANRSEGTWSYVWHILNCMICVLRCVHHVCVYIYAHAYPLWTTSLGHVCLKLSSFVDGDRFECALKVYRRSRGIAPFILILGARRRLVVNFALLRETNSRYPLNRRLVGPKTFCRREKSLAPYPHPGFESSHRIHYPGFHEWFCLIGNVRVLISEDIIWV
jgi:hypothetical protein